MVTRERNCGLNLSPILNLPNHANLKQKRWQTPFPKDGSLDPFRHRGCRHERQRSRCGALYVGIWRNAADH